MNTKVKKLAKMRDKLAHFEQVLPLKLDSVKRNLERVKGNVTAHVIAMEMESDNVRPLFQTA
jgi:hypothetical protein